MLKISITFRKFLLCTLAVNWILHSQSAAGASAGDCKSELGMQSKRIPDENISASSKLSKNHAPGFARLDERQGAWCSAPYDNSPYVQILLGEEKLITKIMTQGSYKDLRWPTKYQIKYLKEGKWITYQKADGSLSFRGNKGSRSLNDINLQPPIRTSSIRVYPVVPNSVMSNQALSDVSCLRLELYGCSAAVESATTAFPPLTQPPVCSMPEKPAQEAGVMGFGHDFYSHVVYNITRYTVLYKLISTRTQLSLEFRASNPNGILLYTAFQPTQSDFIECHLEEGRVSCSFSAGLYILSLTSPQASYSDGKWHTVRLMRENVQGELYLDGIRVDTGSALGSARYINGLKELYLGGTPLSFDAKHVTPGSRLSLPGCIRNVTVNTRDIGPPTNSFKIQNCYRVSPSSGVSFGKGGGFLKAASGYTAGKDEVITLEIKPTSYSGVLLSSSRNNGDYIVLEMIRGNIIFRAENGGGDEIVEYVAADPLELCDGKWRKIKAWKYGNIVQLQVDDGAILEGGGNAAQTYTNINNPLYVGGVPDDVTARGVTATEPYTGCIRNLESTDPGRDAKTLFLTKPLQMAGNIYLGGCPFI